MKKKYRIVTDNYAGYEVQETFLNIFWLESKSKNSNINTHNSIENAKQHIEDLKNKKFYFKSIVVYTE
jgi:hypothetical protein